jgi:hypothetical protein
MTLVKLKNNSAVATIIQNCLENANAILGPFYQSNGLAAQLLV